MESMQSKREKDLQNRMKMLAQFGSIISQEPNLDPLLEKITVQVRGILSCDRCSVFIYDVEGNFLWAKVATGLQNTRVSIPMGSGIVGYVAQSGISRRVANAYNDSMFNRQLDILTGYKTRNILATPLKNIKGEIVGVFEAINKYSGSFTDEDEGILKLISSLAASAIENANLYKKLSDSQLEIIYRLATTAEYRDQQDTAIHLRHISEYSAIIASSMGLSQKDAYIVRNASPLHDIGKVGIADAILLKPGKLTPEEYEEMKKHTTYGEKILSNGESELLQAACSIAAAHHERYDGKGYPYGLKGNDIPLFARIVSVADVFDALCMKRVYKQCWTAEKSREYIMSHRGTQFDPDAAEAFDKAFDEILALHKSLVSPLGKISVPN